MDYIKETALEKVNVSSLAQFLALTAIASALPFFIHLQWVTGPIVNALLIIVLFLVGIRAAVVLCFIPSLMALVGGLLPAPLAPAVPFIMISNVIFVFCVEYFYKNAKDGLKGFWIGVGIGAVAKYFFLSFNISVIVRLLMKTELSAKVAQLMSWPQLATALIGGVIAFAVLKWLKRI